MLQDPIFGKAVTCTVPRLAPEPLPGWVICTFAPGDIGNTAALWLCLLTTACGACPVLIGEDAVLDVGDRMPGLCEPVPDPPGEPPLVYSLYHDEVLEPGARIQGQIVFDVERALQTPEDGSFRYYVADRFLILQSDAEKEHFSVIHQRVVLDRRPGQPHDG